MNNALKIERPRLLTELAFQRIRSAIVAGEFKLGEQLSEVQLAQRIGTSKTPVREALLRLRHERLVEIHPQRGSFIFSLQPAQVRQLLRFRDMLESTALRASAEVDRARLVDGMAKCVDQMVKAERKRDLADLARIDMDFHRQFFAHCGDEYLCAGYDLIWAQLSALRHRSPIANAVDSHQVLVDAVAAGRIDSACALLHEHIFENVERYYAACLVA